MEYIYQRRASFADTDAAGVVHFSRLLCYVEEAEHEMLAHLAIPVLAEGGWPRVNISCDYLAPVRLGDVVKVAIFPDKVGNSSVLWGFTMMSQDLEVAKGSVKTVRVNAEGKPEPISDEWRRSLSRW